MAIECPAKVVFNDATRRVAPRTALPGVIVSNDTFRTFVPRAPAVTRFFGYVT